MFTGTLGSSGSGLGSFALAYVPSGAALVLESVYAPSENVVRLVFGAPVYYSGILDPGDASIPGYYTVTPVAGTTGLDGTAARSVTVVQATLDPSDPTGSTILLTLDRPMTPAYAQYVVSVIDVADEATRTQIVAAESSQFVALYRSIVPPSQQATPSRDLANPQAGGVQQFPRAPILGSFNVDDTGDYAVDDGLTSYKKRVLRRLMTAVGGFQHLPGYGVGIRALGKKLARPSVLAKVAAAAQAQILLEPETATCTVTTTIDPQFPGLVFFVVNCQTKTGQPFRAAVPFPVS
jgi:hypothetical protein